MIMIETNRRLRHQPHRLGNTEHETWNIRFLERPYEKREPPVTYDTRYRYKLDMLEPGTIMLKWVGIFLLIGLALELLRWKLAAAIAFGFSGALCATRVCRFSEEKLGQMLSVEFQAMMLLVKSKAEDAS